MKEFYLKLAVATLIVGGLFGLAWKQGVIARIAAYFGETRDELKKCNWPSRDDLWQTTFIVFFITAVLGLFTVGSDFILLKVVRSLLKL
ncbi:MAG: preprotein translocase subunit SecE [Verrucomicrobiota bacterium]